MSQVNYGANGLPGTEGRRSAVRRVAVFRERFLPLSETFIRDHLLNLPSWQPVAITTKRVPDGLQTPGVPVLEARRVRGWQRVGDAIARRLGADESELRERALTRAIARARPAVVHAHFGPDGALVSGAARRLGLPLVVTFHGYDATIYPEVLRTFPAGALLVEKWDALMREAAAIVACSGFLRDELVSRNADPARLHIIPSGMKTGSLPWSPPPDDGPVLFVGRLVEKKGCADLLRAIAQVPRPLELRIIGDGPLRSELEELASSLAVEAEFVGAQPTEQVLSAMRHASVVAMPSRRASNGDCEGLPVASLEASAMGRPVVGYRHSGLVESVISGETGLLTEEGDVAGLARLIDGLVGNKPELERLARNARRHVEENFDLASCLRRLERVYEQVSGAPSVGG